MFAGGGGGGGYLYVRVVRLSAGEAGISRGSQPWWFYGILRSGRVAFAWGRSNDMYCVFSFVAAARGACLCARVGRSTNLSAQPEAV
jgi:hypothetical protein